jgi:hypothetical protein
VIGCRLCHQMEKAVPLNSSSLPIHKEKNIGITPITLLWVGLIALVIGITPMLLSGGNLLDTVIHSSGGHLFLAEIAGLLLLFFMFRNPATLDISKDGISVSSNKKNYFYDWSDISQVSRVKNATQLELKGRSAAANQYNLISDRFGIKPDDLVAILREEIASRGSTSSPDNNLIDQARRGATGRSKSPADDAKAVASAPYKKFLIFLSIVFAGIFGWATLSQIADYNKTIILQHHGLRTRATILRYYEDSCGKRNCIINVEYQFQSSPDSNFSGRQFRGHAFLTTSDNTNSEDYIYAKSNNIVPIAYDPADPSRSELNFRNSVFNRDPLHVLLTMTELVGGITAVIFSFMAGLMVLSMRQAERKLQAPGSPQLTSISA